MQLERKALYNLLRMNWLQDPSQDVQPWQVEDYRRLSLDELFERLAALDIQLDRDSFLAYADNCESPEELTDCIIAEDQDVEEQDQIYLLVFELWRQLEPEQLCLSVFCDELDYQISLYYAEELTDAEELQDVLTQLENILHQGTDEGGEPLEVFETISVGCANDVEGFLYEFIAEQIDGDGHDYASDLLDAYYDYVSDVTWFDFLKARVLGVSEPEAANEIVEQVLEDSSEEPNLELYLEILAFLAQNGEPRLFASTVESCSQLLESEEDLQDLCASCAEYFQRLDQEEAEAAIVEIQHARQDNDLEAAVNQSDPDLNRIREVVQKSVEDFSA